MLMSKNVNNDVRKDSPIRKRNICFSLKFSSLTHSSTLSHSRSLCYVAWVCSRKQYLNLYVSQGKKDSQIREFAILNRNHILYLLHSYCVLCQTNTPYSFQLLKMAAPEKFESQNNKLLTFSLKIIFSN